MVVQFTCQQTVGWYPMCWKLCARNNDLLKIDIDCVPSYILMDWIMNDTSMVWASQNS